MKCRRRKQFIDSTVQGALVKRIILHWLIFLALASLLLPIWQLWSSGNIFRPFSTIMLEGWKSTAPVFFALVALLPLFIWDTVTFSNRFAGPMYRFHGSIRKLAAGDDVRPIKLRKGDFWTEFADDFNKLLARLEEEKAPKGNANSLGCIPPTDISVPDNFHVV